MSDFLVRLAARQLGDIPVVSPRLPTRFAPIAEPRPDEPLVLTPSDDPADPAGEQPAGVLPMTISGETAITPPQSPTLDTQTVAVAPEPVPPDVGGLAPQPMLSPVQPELERQPLDGPVRPEPSPRAPRTTPPTRLSRADSSAASAVPTPHASNPSPAGPVRAAVQDVEVPPPAAANPPPLLAPPTPQVVSPIEPPSASDLLDLHPRASPPTVTVTIGRLEVRAVPAPLAPERRAPAAPTAISLEAYLEHRQGERR